MERLTMAQAHESASALDRVLAIEEVCRRVGINRSTAYRWAGKNGFPDILRFGPNKSGMLESDFSAWLKSRKPDLEAHPASLRFRKAPEEEPAAKAAPPPPKRGRGRPRKVPVDHAAA